MLLLAPFGRSAAIIICEILKISLLFHYHELSITKIALATLVQSSGTVCLQLLGKQHL